jgi:hypothetical protein
MRRGCLASIQVSKQIVTDFTRPPPKALEFYYEYETKPTAYRVTDRTRRGVYCAWYCVEAMGRCRSRADAMAAARYQARSDMTGHLEHLECDWKPLSPGIVALWAVGP